MGLTDERGHSYQFQSMSSTPCNIQRMYLAETRRATELLSEFFPARYKAVDGAHPMETLQNEGLILPEVEASASFESPLCAGETVTVEVTVTDFDEASLTIALTFVRVKNSQRAV